MFSAQRVKGWKVIMTLDEAFECYEAARELMLSYRRGKPGVDIKDDFCEFVDCLKEMGFVIY